MNDNLGRKGRDILSGFTGVIEGYCEYMTGCTQILLNPCAVKKDNGEPVAAQWFDDSRVEILPDAPVRLNVHKSNGPGKIAPGGRRDG